MSEIYYFLAVTRIHRAQFVTKYENTIYAYFLVYYSLFIITEFLMTIHIRYFASLKERVGRSEQQLAFIEKESLFALWLRANNNKILAANTLAAINQEYVSLHTLVKEGDEVAFFPPVTGG